MYTSIGIVIAVISILIWHYESNRNRRNNPQCPLAKRIIYALSRNPITSWDIDWEFSSWARTNIRNSDFGIPEFYLELRRYGRYEFTVSLPNHISDLIDNGVDRGIVDDLINSQLKLAAENYKNKEKAKFLR